MIQSGEGETRLSDGKRMMGTLIWKKICRKTFRSLTDKLKGMSRGWIGLKEDCT